MAILSPVLRSVLLNPIRNVLTFLGSFFAYNFDGVDDYAVLPYRAINPDGDIDIEFYTPSNISADGNDKFIVSQNIASAVPSHEFSLFIAGATGNLGLSIGGTVVGAALAGDFSANEKLRLVVTGSTRSVYKADGTLLRTASITRGSIREPTAQTIIMARANGSVGTLSRYAQGVQRDIKINGTLWRMADLNQAIQLPEPSGLGAELITPAVLENPSVKGTQWTYLGAGRWQYVGDGSFNAMEPLSTAATPVQGYLEFEVESISGQMTCTRGNLTRGRFNSTGVFRYFYTDINEGGTNNAAIRFTRATNGQVVSCIIKNISFKPLAVANATELVANGNFSAGTTGWTTQSGASLSVTSGQATITTAAGQNSRIEQTLTVQGGFYHEASFDIVALNTVTFARLSVFRGTVGGFAHLADVTRNSAGRISVIFFATGNDAVIQVRGDFSTAGSVIVDNVSVRKLDSLCNPMTLINTTSDRWREIDK